MHAEHALWMVLPGTRLPVPTESTYATDSPENLYSRRENGNHGDYAHSMEIVGDTALIPIYGVIGRHDWWYPTDCAAVSGAARHLCDRDDISTVVLDIQSPGGLAWGISETADEILAMRESGKRVLAWIDPLGASAAYWLAAAADMIIALPSGLVGSIGAVRAFYDMSELFAREGIRLEAFTSDADGKLRGVPGRATTDEDRRVFQASVDEIGAEFREFVIANRPPLGPQVFSGDVWSGKRALQLGLVDALAPDLATALAIFRES